MQSNGALILNRFSFTKLHVEPVGKVILCYNDAMQMQ